MQTRREADMLFIKHKNSFACIENDSICLCSINVMHITGKQISDNDNQLSFNRSCTQTFLMKSVTWAKYDN